MAHLGGVWLCALGDGEQGDCHVVTRGWTAENTRYPGLNGREIFWLNTEKMVQILCSISREVNSQNSSMHYTHQYSSAHSVIFSNPSITLLPVSSGRKVGVSREDNLQSGRTRTDWFWSSVASNRTHSRHNASNLTKI